MVIGTTELIKYLDSVCQNNAELLHNQYQKICQYSNNEVELCHNVMNEAINFSMKLSVLTVLDLMSKLELLDIQLDDPESTPLHLVWDSDHPDKFD